MSAESDLVKGIIKVRSDGWQQGSLGNHALGSGPACLVGAVEGGYKDTDAIRALAAVVKEECSACADLHRLRDCDYVTNHNDHHLLGADDAVNLLKKALARV